MGQDKRAARAIKIAILNASLATALARVVAVQLWVEDTSLLHAIKKYHTEVVALNIVANAIVIAELRSVSSIIKSLLGSEKWDEKLVNLVLNLGVFVLFCYLCYGYVRGSTLTSNGAATPAEAFSAIFTLLCLITMLISAPILYLCEGRK